MKKSKQIKHYIFTITYDAGLTSEKTCLLMSHFLTVPSYEAVWNNDISTGENNVQLTGRVCG